MRSALIPATAQPKLSACQRRCFLEGSRLYGDHGFLDIGYEKKEAGVEDGGTKSKREGKTSIRLKSVYALM